MNYISTRGNYDTVSSAQAIVLGMVPRGGLFIPEQIPGIEMESLEDLNYQELAYSILKPFMTGTVKDYNEEEIKSFISSAYNKDKFDNELIAPLNFFDEKTAVLELWHGPTAAFKDIALQIMPYFLTAGAKKLKRNREIVILVATSGDTGKAALEGYKDVTGTKIIVFYPKEGVSRVQELQMLTTSGSNTFVVGVRGNFDDCQNMVKNIFADNTFNLYLNNKNFDLSSANSINWGRLVPQIVYYFWAYMQMIRSNKIQPGDQINTVVPTGNFGNILAGFYAREMGLPIKNLICASNKNNVLSDFINTGIYNRKREFFKTSSPSMDILISSNLERFLFEITNHNALKINRWYQELTERGQFKVDETTRQRLKNILYGDFATEEETFLQIKTTFEKTGYLLDPHTAVGVSVYEKYKKSKGDFTPAFICGTASPFKFNQAVYFALTGDSAVKDEILAAEKLSGISGIPEYHALNGLEKLKINHSKVIELKQGREVIKEILGI